jgi:hypothetical protein
MTKKPLTKREYLMLYFSLQASIFGFTISGIAIAIQYRLLNIPFSILNIPMVIAGGFAVATIALMDSDLRHRWAKAITFWLGCWTPKRWRKEKNS